MFGGISSKFAHIGHFLYLCSMKRIAYMYPVNWMRGSLSGAQELSYQGGSAYELPTDTPTASDTYRPCLVAKVLRAPYADRLRFFQVRTRATVNMTAANRRNLALMGGAGALFAGLLNDKTAPIYIACMNTYLGLRLSVSFRAFVMGKIRPALAAKAAQISIAEGVCIVNPWVSADEPNVPVKQSVLDKFASELSNS